MFGYVKPDVPYLYVKDETLYNALYCQLCKSIGRECGQCARFSLTYDVAFMSAVIHNLAKTDVKIERRHCVAHPIRKKPMAAPDEISCVLGVLNVVLAYYKLTDDVFDSGKGRAARLFLSSGFKRAAKKHPKLVEIVRRNYEALRALEKSGEKSIDKTADPFALMVSELSDELLGDKASESSYRFFYNLGKWIYLIDALDDYDKDIKKKNYNPFYYAYEKKDYDLLRRDCGEEIAFIMSSTLNGISDGLSGLKFGFNADLIRNVALRGTTERTKAVLSGKKNNEVKDK